MSLVRKTLIINTLGASKFWFLAKVLLIPDWVAIRFKKLVFHFLWGSKIETISCSTLPAPLSQGGLGLIDFLSKCQALCVSTLVHTVSRPHLHDFFLLKYFTGAQLARLRPTWYYLRDNSPPSALTPTAFYQSCLDHLTTLLNKLSTVDNFSFSSNDCYNEFLKNTVTAPIVPLYWTSVVGPGLPVNMWSLIRDPISENFKSDIAWLIALRATDTIA